MTAWLFVAVFSVLVILETVMEAVFLKDISAKLGTCTLISYTMANAVFPIDESVRGTCVMNLTTSYVPIQTNGETTIPNSDHLVTELVSYRCSDQSIKSTSFGKELSIPCYLKSDQTTLYLYRPTSPMMNIVFMVFIGLFPLVIVTFPVVYVIIHCISRCGGGIVFEPPLPAPQQPVDLAGFNGNENVANNQAIDRDQHD
ncbi:hypothetical protein BLNAU_8621 [Blattamonas nauphoetae]|uniref:Uncharacterized protein n=1 Tax=Blattamonas nauphoetae TaxID=2049346 RepID=A0ABQ9XY73_9EUKA|nr:hypothetical protein BLNAU_8621 [Blattamonas nauphoetae]